MNSEFDILPYFGVGVVLRRLGISDLADFQAYRADVDLGRYQGWSPLTGVEALDFLAEMHSCPLFRPGRWAQVGIMESERPTLIGDIGLYLAEDASQAEIGFTLARHAQGRGLATAAVRAAIHLAFEFTKVERILGITDTRNHASIAVLERVGMQKCATRAVEFRGESCVEDVYALPRRAPSSALPPARPSC